MWLFFILFSFVLSAITKMKLVNTIIIIFQSILFPFFVWSHFILGGLNHYLLASKNKYNVLIVVILYCKTHLLLLRWDMGKFRDRFGSMGRLRSKGCVHSVIINVITEIIYRFNYIKLFFKISVQSNNMYVCNNCIVLLLLYQSIIRKILFYCSSWFYNMLSVKNQTKLSKVSNIAAKVKGLSTPNLTELNNRAITCIAISIEHDSTHPLNEYIAPLPSGRRYRAMRCRSAHFGRSLIPSAITYLNNRHRSSYLNCVCVCVCVCVCIKMFYVCYVVCVK